MEHLQPDANSTEGRCRQSSERKMGVWAEGSPVSSSGALPCTVLPGQTGPEQNKAQECFFLSFFF